LLKKSNNKKLNVKLLSTVFRFFKDYAIIISSEILSMPREERGTLKSEILGAGCYKALEMGQ
jgi:hypothetical protein